MDYSLLKYYKELCERGIISPETDDLDSIITNLEEKEFEYLKRFEMIKDENRKDEINELLNIIDLQLKELSAIKTTLNSGIIIEDASKEVTAKKEREQSEGTMDKELSTGALSDVLISKKGKGNSILIIAIFSLACVIAVSTFVIINNIKSLRDTTSTGSSEPSEIVDTLNNKESSNQTMFGINGTDEGLSIQEQLDLDEQVFTEGYYVFDITNKSLIDGGLELGDKIVTMNGEKVLTGQDFYDITAKYKPGDEMVLVVERNHEELTINGVFVTESDLLPYREGVETIKVNGHIFEFNYDIGRITLKE